MCVAAIVASLPCARPCPTDALTYLERANADPARSRQLVGGTGSPILFVAWSLQYEMLFYAIIAVFHR